MKDSENWEPLIVSESKNSKIVIVLGIILFMMCVAGIDMATTMMLNDGIMITLLGSMRAVDMYHVSLIGAIVIFAGIVWYLWK